jgi:hypothetical protein
LAIDGHEVASGLEQRSFKLASMTVQSSFLVRCVLSTSGDPKSGKAYYVQHVQTGAEFRSATLGKITQWVEDQNLRYISEMINTPSDPGPGAQEDIQ